MAKTKINSTIKTNRKLFYAWLVKNHGKETKRRFINNLRKDPKSDDFYDFYKALHYSPQNSVCYAFTWGNAPEGASFWCKISRELRNNPDIPWKEQD